MPYKKLDQNEVHYDHLGGIVIRFLIFQAPDTPTDPAIATEAFLLWSKARYPTERCCHQYDCCGHYYLQFHRARYLGGPFYLLELQSHQNV